MAKHREWSPVEDNILRQVYTKYGARAALDYLPGRNIEQARARAYRLDLTPFDARPDYWPRPAEERTADAALIGWRTPVEPQALRWAL